MKTNHDDPKWLLAVMSDAASMAQREGAVVTAAILKTALDAPDAEQAREAMVAKYRPGLG